MTAEGHLGKAPLLGDDAKHAALGSSEIPRISWRRAIGVFHLYLAWLIAELIALAVGLTALTTDHWIVPSGAALPFVEHAGLWKVCFTTSPTEAEGRATADVDSFARVEDWWRTVDDAFLQIDDDQARLARDTEKGCTRRVAEFYGHVWGNDFVAWLQIIRAFSLLFLYAGFLKILVVSRTYAVTTRGRWLSSAFAVFLAICQTAFGEAAWFLALAIIKKAQDDAPSFLDRGTFASYDGWSFWAFFAAVHVSLLFPSLYLFIEACACCVDERNARFGVWGNAGDEVFSLRTATSKRRRRDAREKNLRRERRDFQPIAPRDDGFASSSSAVARAEQTYHISAASESDPGAFPPLQRLDTGKEPAA